jgi:C1A family cysteine protease
MKIKILTINIILILSLAGFGASGVIDTVELEDNCSCNGYYFDLKDYGGLANEDLVALQKQGEIENWTFDVDENSATQYPLENICGLVVPDGWEDNAHFKYFNVTTLSNLPDFYDVRRTNPTDKNSNFLNNFPTVKNQGNCGSCWAFATVGVLEINIRLKEGKNVDLSEQYLVSCNTDGWGCNGGWWAHDYHQWKEGKIRDGSGAVMEDDFAYVSGQSGYVPSCKSCDHKYLISNWAFIGGQSGIPSVNDIKKAIIDYGAVSVAVYANTAMSAYKGGIFNGCSSGQVNHAVILVGWDDSQGDDGVWFMRNSWGTGWGEDQGYMRIPYGCSSIGYSACYVVYEPQHTINKRLLEVEIHKVSNHPDDGDFFGLIDWPKGNQPEWYYRVGAEVDDEKIYQYNYNRDPEGWWIFKWNSQYRWMPNEVHRFYVDDLTETITIKLMEYDFSTTPDDLADVSAYSGGGVTDGADLEKRGAIYHGVYDLKTNSLTGDTTIKEGIYYITTGEGNYNAKVWFNIYDPVMANPGGPYFGIENVDVEFIGSALQYSGTPPYSYHWDFGDGYNSNQQNPTHKYTEYGNYLATLTVTDTKGDSCKATIDVKIHENTAPNKPSIIGPSNGKPWQEYSFEFTSTDNQASYGDKVSYCVDWGDGSSVEWTDFVSAGTSVTLTHVWSSKNFFAIKAKAKDINGAESAWTTKSFSTPKINLFNTLIMRLLENFANLFELLR